MSSKIGEITYRDEQFLGKQEQNRLQELFKNSIIAIVQKFGQRGLFDLVKENCSIEMVNNIITLSPPKPFFAGFDGDKQLIFLDNLKSVTVSPSVGQTYYVSLRAQQTTFEEGTVSISITGAVVGIDTEFLSLFRNSIERRVSKIKIGNRVYSIQSVYSDTSLQLLGNQFEVINDQNFSVVGTYSPYVLNDSANNTIYLYNSAELVVSTEKPNETNQFQIAVFTWTQANMVLTFNQETLLRVFGPNSVETTDLQDGCVTSEKIADQAVTSEKIADGSVYGDKILDQAVTSEKIADGSVYGDKILDQAVTSEKIADGSVKFIHLNKNGGGPHHICRLALSSAVSLTGASIGMSTNTGSRAFLTPSVPGDPQNPYGLLPETLGEYSMGIQQCVPVFPNSLNKYYTIFYCNLDFDNPTGQSFQIIMQVPPSVKTAMINFGSGNKGFLRFTINKAIVRDYEFVPSNIVQVPINDIINIPFYFPQDRFQLGSGNHVLIDANITPE